MDSATPDQGAIGATLEIQRSQQMEALEQHLIRQQVHTYIPLFFFHKSKMVRNILGTNERQTNA